MMVQEPNNNDQYPFLAGGDLHTPYMIYIRAFNTLSDQDILKQFQLVGYTSGNLPIPDSDRCVTIANDSE